jgi:hypothetical protein
VEKAWKDIAADKLTCTIKMTRICESPSHKCIKTNNRASDATDETEDLEWASAKESLMIPDSRIHARPFKITDHDWDRDTHQNPDGFFYVNRGADILVATTAVEILSLATNGRMTPQRIWRMVMHKHLGSEGFRGIDYYGDISDPRILGELPIETPGSEYYYAIWGYNPCEIMVGLEALGDSELIRRKLILEGKYWVWMNPDWYAPIGSSPKHSSLCFSGI